MALVEPACAADSARRSRAFAPSPCPRSRPRCMNGRMPWLRHFALFLVFVAALFRPAAAGAFSSAPDANAQARVGAFELVTATLVGPASAATCGLHEEIGAAYDGNASGYRLAAAGGGVLDGANFAQKTFERMFSKSGACAGRSDVAAGRRPDDRP